MSLLTTNLAALLESHPEGRKAGELGFASTARMWTVFALCFIFSVLGVFSSFIIFGKTITDTKTWGISIIISAIMLGISYGNKYSNVETRASFTPIDVLQYFSQGVLWPSTWPALADVMGVQKIAPPGHSEILHVYDTIATVVSILVN